MERYAVWFYREQNYKRIETKIAETMENLMFNNKLYNIKYLVYRNQQRPRINLNKDGTVTIYI